VTWLARSVAGSSVYVVADERGWHKIGVTADIDLRLYHLSRDIGFKPVHLVHSVFGDRDCVHIENLAHWSLIDHENHREWFKVDAARAIEAVHDAKRRFEAGERIDAKFAVQRRLVVVDDINRRVCAMLKPGETRHRFIEGAVLAALDVREAVERELERRGK
jgi:hypothetical protein